MKITNECSVTGVDFLVTGSSSLYSPITGMKYA